MRLVFHLITVAETAGGQAWVTQSSFFSSRTLVGGGDGWMSTRWPEWRTFLHLFTSFREHISLQRRERLYLWFLCPEAHVSGALAPIAMRVKRISEPMHSILKAKQSIATPYDVWLFMFSNLSNLCSYLNICMNAFNDICIMDESACSLRTKQLTWSNT